MTDFGDKDPEDAYDAGDPIPVRLGILERVVIALYTQPDDGRHGHRRDDALRVLAEIAVEDAADRQRIDAVRHDLEELR